MLIFAYSLFVQEAQKPGSRTRKSHDSDLLDEWFSVNCIALPFSKGCYLHMCSVYRNLNVRSFVFLCTILLLDNCTPLASRILIELCLAGFIAAAADL